MTETAPATADAPIDPGATAVPGIASADRVETAPAPRPPRSAAGRSVRVLRRGLTWLLILLTAVGATGTVFALWADREIFDTDTYVATVGPIPGDPAVVQAVSTEVATFVVRGTDLEARVASLLPADQQGLAGLVAGGVQTAIQSAIAQFMSSPQFTDIWTELNRQVHSELVRVLRGDSTTISDVGGQLTLNVYPLIAKGLDAASGALSDATGKEVSFPQLTDPTDAAASRAQIEQELGVTLPPDFGEIVIAETNALQQAQDAVRIFETSILISALATLLLAVLAVGIALNRRRALLQVAIAAGIGIAIAGVIVARIGGLVSDYAPEGIAGTLGRVTVERIVGGFDDFVLVFVIVAIVLSVAIYLAGRPSWLPRYGRSAAQRVGVKPTGNAFVVFVSEHVGELRLAGYAVAVLALLLAPLTGASILWTLVLLVAWQAILTVIRAFRPTWLRLPDETI